MDLVTIGVVNAKLNSMGRPDFAGVGQVMAPMSVALY